MSTESGLTIVVGGSKGIGRVCAQQFLDRGDNVLIIARNPPAAMHDPASRLHFLALDLAQPIAGDAVRQAVRSHGGARYLFFCQRYRGEDDWNGQLQFGLTACKELVELLIPHFSAEGDRAILFMSSIAAFAVHLRENAGYHVAKAGINQLARYYARTLGRNKIRVNTIMPFTLVKPEAQAFFDHEPEVVATYTSHIPLGRMGTAQDAANLAEFLCSSKASFISGQAIGVDGGLSVVYPAAHLEPQVF